MSGSSEQELQEEIKELRGELGETVTALVHKVEVPARAKERVNELKEEAIERSSELRDQVAVRRNELRVQAIGTAERAREAVSRTPRDRWAKLAGTGLALIALTVIVRRVRIK